MSAPQRLPAARKPRAASLPPAAPHSTLPAPHIFLPADDESPRALERPFDFKRRPGYYSAAAKVALLRRDKRPPHDELLVDFSQPDVQIELRGGGVLLAHGPWSWQASVANEPLTAAGPWSEAGWRREDECDYLELELPLTSGWKLRRQMLLARNDRFLLLADSLLGPAAGSGEIHYSQALRLADARNFRPQRETRDAALAGTARQHANLVPLALPEWRAEFCHAELASRDGSLVLQQAALGSGLYAPLWIDLDAPRLRRPLTWRRLTVGENLAIVPRDAAAAYRIQSGRQQWLIYRSLTPPRNRSVLGYNTFTSFACLRVLAGAKTEEIIEVE